MKDNYVRDTECETKKDSGKTIPKIRTIICLNQPYV